MTAQTAYQGTRVEYFRHDVMRFFATAVLERPYEELTSDLPTSAAPFYFDPSHRAIVRPSDVLTPLALRDFRSPLIETRHVAAAWLKGRRGPSGSAPLFHIPGLGARGMVVYPRDTALVVVQRRPRRAWKVVRNASFAQVLDNERQAAQVAPDLAPAVLEWKPPGEDVPGYVGLAYAVDSDPVTTADLPAVLQRLTSPLVAAYRTAGVTSVDPCLVLDELHRAAGDLQLRPASAFTTASSNVLRRIAAIIERYIEVTKGTVVHRTFAHGDIQRSNLRRDGRQLALIDWGNAGWFNVLHDAFIIELFSPTLEIWSDVLSARPFDATRGFQGWLRRYVDAIAETSRIRLSPADIGLGLVCGMAEKSMSLVARHVETDEPRGLHSLARVERLLSAPE